MATIDFYKLTFDYILKNTPGPLDLPKQDFLQLLKTISHYFPEFPLVNMSI